MVNNAINWKMTMQRFLAASNGDDLKIWLINAIILCHSSHAKNVLGSDIAYGEILDNWSGEGPLPDGWKIDDDGYYVRESSEQEDNNDGGS
jgi:hypothetical protein